MFERERTIVWGRLPDEAPGAVSTRYREMVVVRLSVPISKEPEVSIIISLGHPKYFDTSAAKQTFQGCRAARGRVERVHSRLALTLTRTRCAGNTLCRVCKSTSHRVANAVPSNREAACKQGKLGCENWDIP